jgi:hypothetical protein
MEMKGRITLQTSMSKFREENGNEGKNFFMELFKLKEMLPLRSPWRTDRTKKKKEN